jgi:acetylornithine deacetylase/succinyl-diaminopimelate desuccinylase-like protein
MSRLKEQEMDAYIASHQQDILEELTTFCAQPSISAQGAGIQEMLAIVKASLERRGFTVKTVPTPTNSPVVIATAAGASSKSVLFYNHYDVQPPEPFDEWITLPFEPSIRDGKFYARGVMDDKGHIICRLAAVDAVRAVYGELPCTIKFIIEGEEETNSPNLGSVIHSHSDDLKSDLCLWEFGDVDASGVSMQYLGFRGILYIELSAQTAELDAHSGIWGTLLANAAWRLTWALSLLKDQSGKVLIPGFYDQVEAPSQRDRELLANLPMIPNSDIQQLGARGFVQPFSNSLEQYRAAVMSPSCTICGLTAGYQGDGPKTIIPARARAKLDFRLVPNQTPEDIANKLRLYLDQNGFSDIQMTILGSENPSRTPTDHPLVQMVVDAAADVYGQPQRVLPMNGGSGPAHLFTEVLHVPIVTVGVGNPDSRIHAPNENIRIVDLMNGIRHTARILAHMQAD